MPKGKYYGPDKYKGKVPKGYKGDAKGKYFGPEKKKGLASTKTKSKTKSTKTKTKVSADQALANKLTDAQYAGILGQLNDTRENNLKQYDRYVQERGTSLNREIGSNNQTGQIVQNAITGRKNEALTLAKSAYDKQELARQLRDSSIQARNSNALSNYEALMQARGIDPSQSAEMKSNMETQQSFTTQLDSINRQSSDDAMKQTGTAMDTLATQAQMANFNAQANARANAQKDYNSQYSSVSKTNDDLAAELAKTKLDKGSANLNTYLTLKKEREQAAAEQAQAALSSGIAMSKQASTDYFKELAANQNQQKIDLDTEKVKISSKKDQRDFLASQTAALNKSKIDIAKIELDAKKNGVYLPKDWWKTFGFDRNGVRITSPSNPMENR